MTGRVVLDGNGDRVTSYALRNIIDGELVNVGYVDVASGAIMIEAPIVWPGGTEALPTDTWSPSAAPTSLFSPASVGREEAELDRTTMVVVVVAFVIVVALGGAYVRERRSRVRDEADMAEYELPREDPNAASICFLSHAKAEAGASARLLKVRGLRSWDAPRSSGAITELDGSMAPTSGE